MRTVIGAVAMLMGGVLVASCNNSGGSAESAATATPDSVLMAWAYPVQPPAAAPAGGAAGGPGAAATADTLLSLPGSSQRFTLAQSRDLFNVADWRPDLHPPMPEVVARGRRPELRACAYCHMPTGQGRPENASLAGLSAEYIIQQMSDFKNDLRVSAESRMGPPRAMIAVAKAATDEEVWIAAAYFASLEYKPWIRVIESDTVPKTILVGGMYARSPEGGTEPLGRRIIEMPEDLERTELRDPGSGFVAYAPVGSLARGEALVRTAEGKTIQCTVCHGDDLKGLGPVPRLAGRSPSYLARQLHDLKTGVRKGEWSPLMASVVTPLTNDDILDIAAYLASVE